MERKAWITGLLLACSFGVAAESPKSVDFSISAQVEVDTAGRAHVVEMGKVTKLSDVPSLLPVAGMIAQRMRERLESWEFVPGTVDGKPADSTTSVYIGLTGSDDGNGGLAVRIRKVLTGGELKRVDMRALVDALVRAGKEGLVTVDVRYDETGNVISASIHDSKDFRRGKLVGTADEDLRKGVLKAAQHWAFVPETVAGHPIAGGGIVPVMLCFSDASTCSQARNNSDGDEPQLAANDPAVTLRSDVAGTTL